MRRPPRVNGVRHHAYLGGELGFTLVEVLVSLVIVLAVAGGMASVYVASAGANGRDRLNVQLLNSARAKIEQIQAIPYSQVGIVAAGSAAGPGYFVRDPYYAPVYDPANGDVLLSDTVTLGDGTQVIRTVTIEAVDDAADGTGGSDSDGVTDPNTERILDYKLVTVTASATRNQVGTLQQRLTTILHGALAVEVEGATGKDAENPPGKLGKIPKTSPPPPEPPPEGCEITDPPDGKGPGKKGTGKQSKC
jgi:prepilin-type N-terminal cleavage/methylation domain-containing protein